MLNSPWFLISVTLFEEQLLLLILLKQDKRWRSDSCVLKAYTHTLEKTNFSVLYLKAQWEHWEYLQTFSPDGNIGILKLSSFSFHSLLHFTTLLQNVTWQKLIEMFKLLSICMITRFSTIQSSSIFDRNYEHWSVINQIYCCGKQKRWQSDDLWSSYKVWSWLHSLIIFISLVLGHFCLT